MVRLKSLGPRGFSSVGVGCEPSPVSGDPQILVSDFIAGGPPIMVERPNTVSGLVAKRAELVAFRKGLEADLRKVTSDIDHLDAAIALFDPDTAPRAIQRYATKHRAKKGQMKRFVLDALREASGPLTSQAIATAWMADRGLRTDEATYVIIRKRVGACLITATGAGLVKRTGMSGVWQGYALVRI